MMKSVRILKQILVFNDEMGGIFLDTDLKSIFNCAHSKTYYRLLGELIKEKILFKFSRGIYLTEKFDKEILSQKLNPVSYISFESILAENLILGTIPVYNIKAIKIGKKRIYESDHFKIEHFGISKHLYFGFENINGVNKATKEKAILDTLYFHCKGKSFYFDIYSDVNTNLFDMKKIKKYLKEYKNPKFVRFVTRYFQELKQ